MNSSDKWYHRIFSELKAIFTKDDSAGSNELSPEIFSPDKTLVLINGTGDKLKVDGNKLIINLACLSISERSKLKEFVNHTALEDGGEILELDSNATIEEIISLEKDETNKKILEKLKGKMLETDYNALRMALFIRHQKFNKEGNNGANVSKLIFQLRSKYGDRGNNISKLCSAGYFEEQILPLCEHMESDSDFDINDFRNLFDIFVNEEGFSVFVNSKMDENDIRESVNNRIEQNKKYGIKRLAIHGIGSQNVKNIRSIITELHKRTDIREKKINEGDSLISAIFVFN